MPGPFVREYFDFDTKDVPKGFFLIWRGFSSIELEGILRRVEARKTNDENGSPGVFPGIFAYTNPDKMKGNMSGW